MLRDSNVGQQVHASGAPIPTAGREDAITRMCTLLQPMDPMLIILIAVHEWEDPLSTPNEEHGRTVPDHPKIQSEAQNLGEFKDEGTIAERPPEVPPEHTSDDHHLNKDTHDTVHPGTSQGGC